jgi:hypothetical protein
VISAISPEPQERAARIIQPAREAPPDFWAAHEWLRATVLAACGVVAIACILYLCYLHINWRSKVLYPILLMVLGGSWFFAGAIWLGLVIERQLAGAATPETASAVQPKATTPKNRILHRHYVGADRDHFSELLFTMYKYIEDDVSPPQLEIHRLSSGPATAETAGRLAELRDKLRAAHRQEEKFQSSNGYFQDEVMDILTASDPLTADIAAINNFIVVALAT